MIKLDISDLELAAIKSHESVSNVQISKVWMTVKYIRDDQRFEYKYGRNLLTREGAESVLASSPHYY